MRIEIVSLSKFIKYECCPVSGVWYGVLLRVHYNSPRVCEAWVGERICIINTFKILLTLHLSLYLMIAECSHGAD